MNKKLLRVELAKKEMTQKELANHLNITESTLNRKINGKSSFSLDEVKSIMRLFDLPINEENIANFFNQ